MLPNPKLIKLMLLLPTYQLILHLNEPKLETELKGKGIFFFIKQWSYNTTSGKYVCHMTRQKINNVLN